MIQTLTVCLILTLIIGGILGYPAWVQWRLNRLKARPFPDIWQGTLEQTLPMYTDLSPAQRKKIQDCIKVLVAQKQFIGCNGVQVTPEMKVIIAAVASLLLLNQREHFFPILRSILIYPNAYWVESQTVVGQGIVEEKREARLGESWSKDQVILSWAQVQQDIQNWQDGRNVILHEFAHQLDQEEGPTEGVPILPTRAEYERWAKVMTEHYQQFCQDLGRGVQTVLDPYGSKSPAEFFAVATEAFFERSTLLKQQHPELYALLQVYYALDPSAVFSETLMQLN